MRLLDSLLGRSPKVHRRAKSQRRKRTPRLGVEPLESRTLLNAASSTGFVSQVYLDLLGRRVDRNGLAFWSSLVDEGIPRSGVVLKIEGSTEYRTGEVQDLYQRLLGRAADPDGLNGWLAFLGAGSTAEQLEARIMGSNEYFAVRGGGTNTGFLQAVYYDVLGRGLDPAGAQSWGQALASGSPRDAVALGILGSLESDQLEVNALYVRLLHRPVDASGLNTFTGLLQSGVSNEQVLADIVSSDEYAGAPVNPTGDPPGTATLAAGEVSVLLSRAAAASASNDAIIVVVDRPGHVLGVRVESGVSPAITGSPQMLTFAIDGALALARTGAFFANNQAPLTSRTVEFISQSTITQREVQSDPDISDPNSPLRGPGFVAPIGLGGHFPPRVANTPPVDLFGIEHTNRDSIIDPGPDRIKGTADDVDLRTLNRERFNIDNAFVPAGQQLTAPESYGFISGIFPAAQARGIGTLPGGIPLFKDGVLVGGIGVFFPGTTGFATEENSALSIDFNPARRDRSMEAEWMAFAAAGGSLTAGYPIGTLAGIPPLPGFDLPFGRIDLAGITLDIFGPGGNQGPQNLVTFGQSLGVGNPNSGVNEPLFLGDTVHSPTDPMGARDGALAPEGWLVVPHAGGNLTAADVTQIIVQGITEANRVRAQIRLPLGSRTRMVFAVADSAGDVLGLFRMLDATIFSEDVAVAKARNVAYYDDPTQLLSIDQIAGLPVGVAFTNRTFRFTAQPRFPEGVDGAPPGPHSILNDGGTNPLTGLESGPPLPVSAFQSVYGFDAFNPDTNFHQPFSLNQNGIVFFPGSSAAYKVMNGVPVIVGGFGVSGDGVDQDDVVTASGILGFQPPAALQADQFSVRGVSLPYQKFPRNPEA